MDLSNEWFGGVKQIQKTFVSQGVVNVYVNPGGVVHIGVGVGSKCGVPVRGVLLCTVRETLVYVGVPVHVGVSVPLRVPLDVLCPHK